MNDHLLALFMRRVEYTETCWLWTGSTTNGYGTFAFKDGGKGYWVRAHRWHYEQMVGPIPEGLELDHLCRVRRCVRILHLEAVTPRENSLRGDTLAAANVAKTYCKQGHEYTEENTGRTKQGWRYCKECHRKWNRETYHRAVQH